MRKLTERDRVWRMLVRRRFIPLYSVKWGGAERTFWTRGGTDGKQAAAESVFWSTGKAEYREWDHRVA